MTKEATHKTGNFILPNCKVDHAIRWVTKRLLIESVITGEERGSRELVEQRDNCLIKYPFLPHFTADLAYWNMPTPQKLPLMLRYILIKKIHPAARSCW